MRLFEKYRPRSLREVIGQPPVRLLSRLIAEPYPCCILIEGGPGVGKTAAAYALAADLGCYDETTFPRDNPPAYSFGFNTGLQVVLGSELTIDAAREMFGQTLRLRYGSTSGFKVLVIEELERLSPQTQVFLKTALETKLPPMCIVVATSNDVSRLDKPLLQRFKTYHFSSGESFARAAVDRLNWIWQQECPDRAPPSCLESAGWDGEEFSLRVALDSMQDWMAMMEVAHV